MLVAPALHVAWFENPARHPVDFSLAVSGRSALLVAACAVALGAAWTAQRLAGDRHWPRLPLFERMAPGAPTLLAIQAAVALVFWGVQPALLAPHLHLSGAAGVLLGALQVGVAFSFITGLGDRLGGLGLGLLALLAFPLFGFLEGAAQLHWLGIGVLLLAAGSHASRIGPGGERALTVLRASAGLAILAAALGEKIWNPDLGLAFLAHHPHFNFVRELGVGWFGDDRFVLAAGLAEGVMGVLLLSGLLTRLVIVAMFVPFNLTVPLLPPQELIGHLPIFAIMYLLLVHGGGGEPEPEPARPG